MRKFTLVLLAAISVISTGMAQQSKVQRSAIGAGFGVSTSGAQRLQAGVLGAPGGVSSSQAFTVRSGYAVTAKAVLQTQPFVAAGQRWIAVRGTVVPNGTLTSAWFEAGTITPGAHTTAKKMVGNGYAPVIITDTLRNLQPDSLYYFRVVAENAAGTSRDVVVNQCRTLALYPATYTLQNTFGFPSHQRREQFAQSDYRIVGLPGNSTADPGQLISGTAGADWRMTWDNGASSGYTVVYDGSAMFRFSTGRAFWLIKKGDWSVNTTGITASLTAAEQVEVPLHSGWNLITNPFTRPMAWSAVLAASGLTTRALWAYQGSWQQASTLEPYKGYLFDNSSNAPVLKFPYASLQKVAADSPGGSGAVRIAVALRTGDLEDRSVMLGTHPQASAGRDEYDERKPRGPENLLRVSVVREDVDPGSPEYAVDIRPPLGDRTLWPLSIRGAQGKPCELVFDGLRSVPDEQEIYLVDEERARIVSLRTDSVYRCTPATDGSRFKVLVGTREALHADLSGVLPVEFELGNNFPNPFNPATMLPVAVPRDANVDLKVYGILGNLVKTLHAGTLQAGRHWFTWDGTNEGGRGVASGTYLAVMYADDGSHFVHRMLLIR